MKTIPKRLLQSLMLALSGLLALGAQAKTLDMLVLYTPAATQTWEGRDIDARIESFIEYFNRTLTNSDTDLSVRVVHTEMMNWGGNLNRATNYNLTQLTNDARVNELRNRYGADVVSLVYQNPAGESCGIGWISTGKYGQFYSQAASGGSAYNLSAVNCYIHIIAHETGHNMGLRHSPVQDRQDGYSFQYNHLGTYEYSRGYGISGTFITPMAYPSAYGTWNVQPVYSSPRKTCANQPCGKVDFADAAWSLKMMASQIAAFRPTRVAENNPTNPTQPTTPTTVKFDFAKDISGWSGYYSQVSHMQDVNGNWNLWASNRNQSYSGAIGNLSGIIGGNKSYRIEADVWINNNAQNQLLSWLYVENEQGQYQWLRVTQQSVAGYRWIHFAGDINVTFGQVKRALLYVYGPNAYSEFLLDNVTIRQQ